MSVSGGVPRVEEFLEMMSLGILYKNKKWNFCIKIKPD